VPHISAMNNIRRVGFSSFMFVKNGLVNSSYHEDLGLPCRFIEIQTALI
jgi:hypothetical protein